MPRGYSARNRMLKKVDDNQKIRQLSQWIERGFNVLVDTSAT